MKKKKHFQQEEGGGSGVTAQLYTKMKKKTRNESDERWSVSYSPRGGSFQQTYCKTQNSGLRSKEEKPRDPISQPSRCNTQEGLLTVAQTG